MQTEPEKRVSPYKTFLSPQPTYKELTTNKAFSVDHILENSDIDINQKQILVEKFTPKFNGSIELIIGPMFAGKSTELLRRVQRHAISGKSCLYIKYAADIRYDVACISTHDQ